MMTDHEKSEKDIIGKRYIWSLLDTPALFVMTAR